MERPLRGALRGLCLEFGWSYAVVWKTIGDRKPMRLIFEDGYYVQKPGMQVSETSTSSALKEQEIVQSSQDGQMHMLISKMMASQVHVVGDGLVGEAAASGSHRWILRDDPNGFGSSSKGIAEISYQLLADIQTIVIIPVLPFGVIQLGSTQTVLENPGFVNHVKRLFMQLNYGPESLPFDNVSSKIGQIYSLPGALNSRFSSVSSRTKIDNLANGCHELVSSACKSPYSAVASQFNRMPPIGSGVISSQETIETGKLILDMQASFLKVEAQQALMPEADCGDKIETLRNSDMSPNILKNPGDELSFNSGIGTFKITNTLPSSLDDVKSAALFSGSETCKNANDSGSSGCLPYRSNGTTKSCDSISKTLNSFSTQTPFGLSQDNHRSITRVPHSESTRVVLNKKVAQVSRDCSSESVFLGSCSKFIPDNRQEPASSNSICDRSDQTFYKGIFMVNDACTAEIGQNVHGTNDSEPSHASKHVASLFPLDSSSGSDLFDLLGLNYMSSCLNGSLDDVFVHNSITKAHQIGPNAPKTTSELDFCHTFGPLKDVVPCCEAFSVTDDDQLLDAVISRISSGVKQGLDDDVSCKTSLSNIGSSQYSGSAVEHQVVSANHKHDEAFGLASGLVKNDPECSNYGPSTSSSVNPEEYSQNIGTHKSQIHLWVENGQTIKYDSLSAVNDKKVTEGGKLTRKRPRPGENPRPRPKDRQMIQDRVKELREIVPNGAKCSIDALLEKTIKHMLFLQSVTKHADKLKDTGEPKISNEEGGLLLKDNFEGGATWAFEVGTQSMICPIIVEDLHPPRQLLVEMLCEERGFFLEIADFIKGLGLTILKGVMEARKNKVWARFAVEANRDVTRMEIFLSLVKLLEPSSASNITLSGTMNMPYTLCHQTSIPATGLPDHLQ